MNRKKTPVRNTAFSSALLLLVGFCGVAVADDAVSLIYVKNADINRCLEIARLSGPPVIARLPSGILLAGSGSELQVLKAAGVSAQILTYPPGAHLYQVRSERGVDRGVLDAYGRVLVSDGNCAIIARDAELSTAQQWIDRDVRLVALDLSPKPYRRTTSARLLMPPFDPSVAALVSQVDTARINEWVLRLQGYRTRYLASVNRFELADTIRNRFLAMGISDVTLDTFATPYQDSSGNNLQMNVVATIPGTGDTGTVYIVGGHYDSYTDVPYVLAPGADDNGTGSAAVMEMARILAANPPRRTVRCIAFAAEEVGDLGSNHYAAWADSVDMNIGFMLCNDVMGNYQNTGEIEVYRYPGIEAYGDLLGQCASTYTAVTPRYIVGYYSSDDWAFWQHGYPAGRGKEYPYSNRWHTTSDSLPYVSASYCAELTKAGLAMTAIMANYPGSVSGIMVRDVGDGQRLYASWQQSAAANITGYRLFWGRASGVYTDSATVSITADTIGGLLTDSLYYIAVAAMDVQGRLSPFLSEATGTPRSFPLAPSPVTATPLPGGIRVDWKKNRELDLAGYALYRRIDSGPSDSLTTVTDSTYLDQPLGGASRYYYTVKAFDRDGNRSAPSAEAYGRPFTFDQGILIVDETYNWTTGNYPRDTTQDKFYHAILGGYRVTDWEFDSAQHRPALADFAPYSTVLWHGDDRTDFLAASDTTALRKYLTSGGKLWIVGWEPLADLRNGTVYPDSFTAGNFIYNYLKISRVNLSTTSDTFIAARGAAGYPDVTVDSAKVPLAGWKGTMRYIESLTPVSPAGAVYTIDMKNNGSPFEGLTCGIRYLGTDYKLVYCGYPLYFMKQAEARALAVQVMSDFGEPYIGVAGKPQVRIPQYQLRLEQCQPNPFTRATTINYQLPAAGGVSLSVYNIAGQRVRTLVDRDQQPGCYSIDWNGRDDANDPVVAGIYLYRLNARGNSVTRKMIIIR